LRERKTGPDGLDAKDAEGGAALGNPTSMRSWLPYLDFRWRKEKRGKKEVWVHTAKARCT